MQDETIKQLAQQVRDESQPIEARRDALRHICTLRGEPTAAVAAIPPEDLASVAGAMVFWPEGIKPLTCVLVLEAIKEGKAQRMQSNQRRV
jgi:hypothetical protein